MSFSSIFFDLDGTITDSMPGITRSVSYALSRYGIEEKPENLRMFVGPPLRESFQKYYPETFNEENVDEVIEQFKVRYAEKGIRELTLYEGIPELLAALHAEGKTVALATSKAEVFARQILEEAGIARFFARIAGADYALKRLSKADVLRHALSELPGVRAKTSLMVGDREHDIFGAHEVGMRCAAVLYGYGGPAEFAAAGADYTVASVADLRIMLSA